MLLYHTDLGFPRGTRAAVAAALRALPPTIEVSPHYIERRIEKGLPASVTKAQLGQGRLVELQASETGRVTRLVIRMQDGITHDLTCVVDVRSRCVITGWFNRRDDWHRLTSDRSARYTRPS